jgi:hypothetical protein
MALAEESICDLDSGGRHGFEFITREDSRVEVPKVKMVMRSEPEGGW